MAEDNVMKRTVRWMLDLNLARANPEVAADHLQRLRDEVAELKQQLVEKQIESNRYRMAFEAMKKLPDEAVAKQSG